jgi:hypothetical protein
VRVRPCEVEVQLIGVHFGEELSAAGKVFQVEELVFFESVHRLHIALVGVRGRRDAHLLAVAERFREIALELPAVIGLPDQIAQRDAVTIRCRWMREANTALAEALRSCAKAQNSSPLRISRAVYWITGKCKRCACAQ